MSSASPSFPAKMSIAAKRVVARRKRAVAFAIVVLFAVTIIPGEALTATPLTPAEPNAPLLVSSAHFHTHDGHAHDHEPPMKSVTPEFKHLRIDELQAIADAGRISKEAYYAEVARRDPQAQAVEDELPPEFGLFVQLGLHTRIPLMGQEALASFTFVALEDVENLRLRPVNTSAGISVADGPASGADLAGVSLAKGEQLVVPVAVIPTALGESRVTWEITALVRGNEIERRATIIADMDAAIERSTLHQELSSLLPSVPMQDSLVMPMAAGSPASSYTGNRVSKISFVNGLDPLFTARRDINGNWNSHMVALQSWGWSGTMGGSAYYECDNNWSWNVEHHGDHSRHQGSRTQAENHGGALWCGAFQPPTGSHNQETSIEHIAYHWAWTMWEHFPSQCIKSAGHSMGGLIVRYALFRIQEGDTDFPLNLCIDDAVTLGTPHGGSHVEGSIYDADSCTWYYQCNQMEVGSPFLTTLGQGNGRTAQGFLGTDWTAMGSTGDGSVTAAQATTNFAPAHAIVYEEAIEHSSSQGDIHWTNTVSGDITANIRWTDQPLGFEATSQDAPWPGRFMDMSLAYNQWGCGVGSTSSAWPLKNGVTTLGEPYTTSFHCWYYIDVPTNTASLDVVMTSLAGRDMDLYVRQGSPTGTLRCAAATSASTETCSVSNPAAGRYYIRVYNYALTRDPFTITASLTAIVHDLIDTYPTSYPSGVSPGASYSICWTVQGSGSITHTNIHYGTSSSLGSVSTSYTGTAPQNFCTTLTAPSSGTIYFRSHAMGPNDDLYSGLYTISVQSVSQNDCGTGGDAGDTHATATSISLPVSGCTGQLTSTDTNDYYKFSVSSGQTITASMTPNSGAAYDICLYPPSSTSAVQCDLSSGNGDTVSISYSATSSGEWRLRVFPWTGTGTYTMSASLGDPPQNDCGTGSDAGNSFSTATTITLPKTNCQGKLTSSDTQDWYKFNVASGSTISASMTPPSGADFDLCLYNPSGTIVTCSTQAGSNTDSVTHTATVSGNWALRVYQYSGTGTYTLSVSATAGSVTIRDDDGSRESEIIVNYNDDTVRKYLDFPSGVLTGKTSATLYIYGKSLNCGGGGGNRWQLEVNNNAVTSFDACAKWSSSSYGWATFSIPLSTLANGGLNKFYIHLLSGDWMQNSFYAGIDTSTDYGRSDITWDGTNYAGELMWYIVIS